MITFFDNSLTYIYYVYTFELDEKKNKSNIEKHGVSFSDAKKVFDTYTQQHFSLG